MQQRSTGAVAELASQLSRRAFLGLCAAAASAVAVSARADAGARPREGSEGHLRWLDFGTKGPDGSRTRALLFKPLAERRAFSLEVSRPRYPALLLLHAASGAEGLQRWRTRYALFERYAELRRPPLALGPERARFMPPAQLARLNRELEKQPFKGLVLLCPQPPAADPLNLPESVIASYCEWLEHELLPRAALLAPIDPTPCLGLVGYASGARLALEVFARKPHLFRTFGAAQPEFGVDAGVVARRARQAAAHSGFAGIQLQTSTGHRHRAAVRRLHRALSSHGVATTLDELLGPADEASWREAGLLSVLAGHERSLQLLEPPGLEVAPLESDPPPMRQPGPPQRG